MSDVFEDSGQGFGGQNSRYVEPDGAMTFGGPNEHPGAVRTAYDGRLSFLDTITEEVESLLPSGLSLPSEIKAGLTEPSEPVDVKVANRPGAAKGRAIRMTVKGTNNAANATRLLTADTTRRAFTLYNWPGDNAAGTIFVAYSESEALQGNGFPIPLGGAITREYTGELWASTDSATDVLARLLTESDE